MAVLREPSTIARLAAETRDAYARVDATLGSLDHATYLRRLYGWHAPVERALAGVSELGRVVADAKLRNNKLALLAHDLVIVCGGDRDALAHLPRIEVPSLADVPVALAWMYVLETTTVAARRRGGEARSAYLACYGRGVAARWHDFAAAVDEYAARTGSADLMVGAATDCLGRVDDWLQSLAGRPRPACPGATAGGVSGVRDSASARDPW